MSRPIIVVLADHTDAGLKDILKKNGLPIPEQRNMAYLCLTPEEAAGAPIPTERKPQGLDSCFVNPAYQGLLESMIQQTEGGVGHG